MISDAGCGDLGRDQGRYAVAGVLADRDVWLHGDRKLSTCSQRFLGVTLRTDTPEFWFAMQIAMLCGFATAYPMNWLLIRTGIKEKM